MERVFIVVGRLVRQDEGQDLIEYALLAVLISVAAIVCVRALGNTVNAVWWEFIAANI